MEGHLYQCNPIKLDGVGVVLVKARGELAQRLQEQFFLLWSFYVAP